MQRDKKHLKFKEQGLHSEPLLRKKAKQKVVPGNLLLSLCLWFSILKTIMHNAYLHAHAMACLWST